MPPDQITGTNPKKKIHPTVGRALWVRAIAFPLGSWLVIDALPPGPNWIIVLILFFGFVYPTLFHHMAIRTNNTRAW
jgi:hypothetical protein